MNVELRHLRSFIVLAEELNFTRAAGRLNIVQQALSAQMRQLEDELGAALFVRTTRKVELTPAGRALLEHAPVALRSVESAFDQVRDSVAGERGSLTLGLVATASLDFTPRVLRNFAEDKPNVNVSIRNVAFDDPTGGVRSRQADVALVWRPFDEEGLACEPLFTDRRVAVLPIDHPLAAAKTVDAAALAAEPFVWVDNMDEIARGFWTLADVRQGRPPRVGARITGFEDLFAAVRAGRAVAACPGSVASTLPWRDLVTRPIPGLAPAVVAACWRATDQSPFVKAFVACALRAAGTDAAAASTNPTRTKANRRTRRS